MTQREFLCIVDALNGVLADERTLALNVAAAIRDDRLDEKWEIDGEALLNEIEQMSPEQVRELTDKVAEFWGQNYYGPDMFARAKALGFDG